MKLFASYLVSVISSPCRGFTYPYACLARIKVRVADCLINVIVGIIELSVWSIGWLIALETAVRYNVLHVASALL